VVEGRRAAVVVGELLVELGQGSAEVRAAVGEEHADAGLGEVERGLDAGDPCAHDEDGPRGGGRGAVGLRWFSDHLRIRSLSRCGSRSPRRAENPKSQISNPNEIPNSKS
jgi:hypothetical protein